MMRLPYICLFLLFTGLVNSQPIPKQDPLTVLINNFQKFSDNDDRPDVDSAFYYAKGLASDKRYLQFLNDYLHNFFAQNFRQRAHLDPADSVRMQNAKSRRILGVKILDKMMGDTGGVLKEIVHPMFLLTKVQDNIDNPAALKRLTEAFIKTEIEGKDIYKNRSAKYGLMISDIVGNQPELVKLHEKLFKMITANLKENQIKAEDAITRAQQDKRAWYRYLYAYVNYAQSEKTVDVVKKGELLKVAFDFSPDIIDKNHQSAYFYDMVLILGGKNDSFEDEYLDFITKNSEGREQVLSALVKIALVDPEYKEKLKTYYDSSSSPRKSFDVYWSEIINNGAKDAHPILLAAIDNQSFSSKNNSGKWILVDFWGTWCGPCREEHPELQKFYDSTVVKNTGRITLLTIACNDQIEKVTAYMKEKNFSFPVAMSDRKIEKTYAIQGYPAKILITPIGKYVTVPFGIDWVDFVKKYSGLE